MTVNGRVLDRARSDAGLTVSELWLRYFSLGGIASPVEVEAYLHDALTPTRHEYDVLAHAINERYVELGGDHPVPYADEV
jgi:hypothetical protein